MSKTRHWLWALLLAECLGARVASGQIDPVKRELIQLGYNQPLEGNGPVSGYAYYYYNQPSFLRTNLTLRLAIAPVYVDSELGISQALGPNTDVGIGLAGGGFADSYYEIRQGQYLKSESFNGNGGQVSASVYHLFNPGQLIPLNAVLRGESDWSFYQKDEETAGNFVLPEDKPAFKIHTGLRWGGKEPLLAPDLGMELSVWYEGQFRLGSGDYGIGGDRHMESVSHLFWARALLAYTLPQRKDNFMVSITAGTSADADRFSAYRLGGVLPLASEFPLTLPGYYYQELSANRFALLNGTYFLPLDAQKRWELTAVGSTALVDYIPGLEQPGHWHSGIGGGITYHPHSQAWRIVMGYGYGFDAIRSHGRGAQSVGMLVQFDLERTKDAYDPGANSSWLGGFDRIMRSFQ